MTGRTASIVPPILGAAVTFAAAMLVGEPGATAQFASGIDVVEVYATVSDADGRMVTGLGVDDFLLSEDGRPQTITTFSAGEFPLVVAVGLDRSFSMTAARLSMAKSAARALVGALRPADQVLVVSIGSETEIIAGLSVDHDAARSAIDRVDRWGTTPLYDATVAALEAIRFAPGRRALILLSDGDDRGSRTSGADLVDRARRSGVLLYPIAIGRARVPIFAELAAVTGGRSSLIRDAHEASSAGEAIARELRFQYLLGYTPATPPQDGPPWRSIQVSVKRPSLRVRARDGYQSR